MTTLTICITCRNAETRESKPGEPTGESFLAAIRAATEGRPFRVRSVACLMGCDHGCNMAISAEGKLTYVLGRFDGTAEDAAALSDYAALYHESETGRVPFRQWPQGVKGHFIARVPPLDAE
ncbi:DUF1636 domain-containing protein [Tropicimonas sp. IMCC6043]|uniref:DUF1636 family protein n=1 Tax=Tropicimonas sp. IMCC6043 TaxID=2510645 RepID=UPI00101D7CA1|nr:DUF1636 domain-containing protein [Tropicimonas sp. IMCC6043]RYH11639.1 DUF1636 domain-containing protein [Tropicimonas sp. IMCC6043]